MILKPIVLTATFILAAIQAAPQTTPPNPADNGTVEGYVRRAGTSEGIADMPVTLAGPRETVGDAMLHAVRTDPMGHFIFKDAAPNTYSVTTGGDGYFKPNDGTGRNTAYASKSVTLAAKQHIADVVIELVSAATVHGRIRDSDGDPVVGAEVQILTPTYRDGIRTLTSSKTATTDDRGEYRMFWLNPGDYYVRTNGRAAVPAFRQESNAAAAFTYFPGTLDERNAEPVITRAGMEETADLRLVEPPARRLFSISGKLLTAIPGTEGKRVTSLYVVPRGTHGLGGTSDSLSNTAYGGSPDQFQISGVPPGEYDLYPRVQDNQGHSYTARTPIEVVDRNIDNIAINIRSGVELRGRFVVDGAAPSEKLGNATVQPLSLDGVPSVFYRPADGAGSAVPVADRDSGQFLIQGVVDGKYRLASNVANSSTYYIADILQGSRSVFDNGFAVTSEAPEPFEIRVSSRGGIAEGTVRDSRGNPVANATVVVIPPVSRRQNSVLFKRGPSDKDGRFSIKAIAPGDYKIFAWANVPAGAWENADFMQRYEQLGRSVTITSTQTANVPVTVIP